jgi:hypothetical protein
MTTQCSTAFRARSAGSRLAFTDDAKAFYAAVAE